jgi:hypothetical protein
MASQKTPRDRGILPRSTRVARAAGIACMVAVIPGVALSEGSHPDCIQVWGESRFRDYGYDHIVHLNNECDSTALCDITTNVNPVTQRVLIPSKQAVDVLTFRGSPSREFVPTAECELIMRAP